MYIDAIDHVQLAMPPGGEQLAIDFYEGVLGITQVPKPPKLAARGGCWFERGALRVHVGVQDDFVPATKAHVAFAVIDIDRMISTVTDAGYEHREVDDGAGRQVYVDDPFGNRLEFRAERSAPSVASGLGRVLRAAREVDEDLELRLAFMGELDRLRAVQRRSWVLGVERRENTAEHSWHVAMLALVLAEYADETIDIDRAVQMLLVHDIVEIDAGDTFIHDDVGHESKTEREIAAANRIFGLLPVLPARSLRALWDEHEAGQTPTARYSRAIDRLAPLLLNVAGPGLTWQRYGITSVDVRHVCAEIGDASDRLGELLEALIDGAVESGLLAP